jgi:ribonucleotide monophosphatase NagD (HAD superfamily)
LKKPRVKGFMFDLDGTLVLGDRSGKSYDVLPGAVEVLTHLRARGIPWLVLTNGSGQVPAQQAAKLRTHGLPVDDGQMFTPSSVTAQVFTRAGHRRVLVLGSPGVGHVLKEQGIGITFTGEPDCERVDAVYIGWHPDCGMKDIEAACNAIWNGAKLYIASDVPFFAARRSHHRLLLCHQRGSAAHDRRARHHHRQALAACAALHRGRAGREDHRSGRGG